MPRKRKNAPGLYPIRLQTVLPNGQGREKFGLALFFTLLAGLVIWGVEYDVRRALALQQHSRAVWGQIVNAGREVIARSMTDFVVVRYAVPIASADAVIERKFTVSQEQQDAFVSAGRAEVIYHADDPHNAELAERRTSILRQRLIELFAVLVALYGWLALLRG